MSVDKFCSDIGLWVLVLDGVVSFCLVITQRLLDILETGGLDVVDVICKEDCILHCIYCTGATAWEELVGSYRKTITKVGTTGEKV
jgi:hypothetical protein